MIIILLGLWYITTVLLFWQLNNREDFGFILVFSVYGAFLVPFFVGISYLLGLLEGGHAKGVKRGMAWLE